MLPNHPKICLFQPEIPQNTGNIGRLAAATGSRLCLIKPFGFSTSDKNLMRPGLDYWPFLDLEIYDDIEPLLQEHATKLALFSKTATKPYTSCPPDTELFIFGQETSGLPQALLTRYPEHSYKIPMFHPGVRSLNLANAVGIVIYNHLSKIHQQFSNRS